MMRELLLEPTVARQTKMVDKTPLMYAVESWNVKRVAALIEAGADVNAQTTESYTALHCLINLGGWEMPKATRKIAKLLVEADANLEVPQHWGWTPLMYAILEGTTDDVEALLEVGADPNKVFPQHALPEFTRGRSALAISSLNPDKMELLLNAGADVNLRDDYGQTALEYVRNLDAGRYERQKWVCWNLLREAQNQTA